MEFILHQIKYFSLFAEKLLGNKFHIFKQSHEENLKNEFIFSFFYTFHKIRLNLKLLLVHIHLLSTFS